VGFFVNKLISTDKIASAKEGVNVTDSTENHLNTCSQRLYLNTWRAISDSSVVFTEFTLVFRMHA
jgi:hypothetical protein